MAQIFRKRFHIGTLTFKLPRHGISASVRGKFTVVVHRADVADDSTDNAVTEESK